MTQSSKEAYFDTSNQVARMSHREKIYKYLDDTNSQLTCRELAYRIGLNHISVSKRCSDLYRAGLLIIVGSKKEGRNNNSIYAINRTPQLFTTPKKTRFEVLQESVRRCVNAETYEAIFEEFERLKKINK